MNDYEAVSYQSGKSYAQVNFAVIIIIQGNPS
jgi:hypothetical protein